MRNLRNFVEVAKHRSFSVAAERLGVTQSAASQRVLQLEKQLGVTLIDRSVRPLALTPAGDAFLRGCRDLLDRYERLQQRVTHIDPLLEGTVHVSAIYSAGIDLLSHVRDEFVRRHPRAEVTIEYKHPDEVYDAVSEHLCDLGIVSYPQRWRDVGCIALREERMAVVCAPQHSLARMKHVHASELTDWPMVTFESTLPVGRAIRKYLKEHEASPQITNVFDNIDTLKSAVAVTDQFTILPQRTVLREVAAGSLVVARLEPQLTRPLGIIFRRNARNGTGTFTPAVQAFIDFLLEQAGPDVDLLQTGSNGESTHASNGNGNGNGKKSAKSNGNGHDNTHAAGKTKSQGGAR